MELKKTVKQFHTIRDNVDTSAWWFDRGDYTRASVYMFGAASQAKTLANTLRKEAMKGENNEPGRLSDR